MNYIAVLKGILLILALTMDSFVVSFAYGVSKTKMPFGIVVCMNLLMSTILGTAIFMGGRLAALLPEGVTGDLDFSCCLNWMLQAFLLFFKERGRRAGESKGTESAGGTGACFYIVS